MPAQKPGRWQVGAVMIATAKAAADLFGPCFEAAEAEVLAVAFLDCERRLIEVMVLDGSVSSVALPVRRVIEEALRLEACGLVLAHNHPSGDAQPSWQDIEVTRDLAATAQRLGLSVHDHLIFGEGEICSVRGLGLL